MEFEAPAVLFGIKNTNKAPTAQTRLNKKRDFKMAKGTELKDVPKAELAEAYSKLKSRTKGAQEASKKEGEALVRDAITIASGGALGYYMGMMHGDAESDKDYTAAAAAGDTDKMEELLADAQQMAGIDLDLLVGGAAAVAGLMKLGGKMSDTVRAVGVGALAEWAGRTAYNSGHESALEEDED